MKFYMGHPSWSWKPWGIDRVGRRMFCVWIGLITVVVGWSDRPKDGSPVEGN